MDQLKRNHISAEDKKFSQKAIKYVKNPANMGRMTDPDGAAYIKGLCGDTMEMYMIIENDIVKKINFYTDGCNGTLACGSAVTIIAKRKNVHELLKISPQDIIDKIKDCPEEYTHCAILSVNTLYKAIADYLLKEIK